MSGHDKSRFHTTRGFDDDAGGMSPFATPDGAGDAIWGVIDLKDFASWPDKEVQMTFAGINADMGFSLRLGIHEIS